MKSVYKKATFMFFALAMILSHVKSDAVCSLEMLIMELKQDIADNGMLDCQRVIEPLHYIEESEDQTNLRLAAQWDTSCSFEASDAWLDRVRKNFGIRDLVDSFGDRVPKDFRNQADMCEIIRAAVAQNLFNIPNLNMQNLPINDKNGNSFLSMINCPGAGENSNEGSRICAASGGTFYQSDTWNIFLDSSFIKFLGAPKFIRANRAAKKIPDMGDLKANLMKTFLKFDKKNLQTKQNDIASLVDTLLTGSKKVGNFLLGVEEELTSSKNVKLFIKNLNDITFPATRGVAEFPNSNIKFRIPEEKIIIAFYQFSHTLSSRGHVYCNIQLDNLIMEETAQTIGQTTGVPRSSAVGQIVKKTNKEINLSIVYNSLSGGQIKKNNMQQYYSGIIVLPTGSIQKFSIKSSVKIQMSKDVWQVYPKISLDIKFDAKRPYYLLFYNLSFNSKEVTNYLFSCKFRIDGSKVRTPVTMTRNIGKLSQHGAYAIRISKNTKIQLDYKWAGDKNIDTKARGYYGQSIHVVQLPPNSNIQEVFLSRQMKLSTDNKWKGFGFNIKVNVPDSPKAILIIFQISLNTSASFASQIKINEKDQPQSLMQAEGIKFNTNIQGYLYKILKKGDYTIDLTYITRSDTEFNPKSDDTVFLQVVELD